MNQFDQRTLNAIGKGLLKNSSTIAVAESVTSGLLQWALGSITDAMKFYQGGITTYNIAQKFHHLRVEPISAESCNAVSAQVAAEMALGVTRLFGSQWGIGITGFATPVPESGGKRFAYYAIAQQGRILAARQLKPRSTSPEEVQLFYANAVLADLRKLLYTRK
jgi:nicotinamide-nucleotide amidase